ncbi:hypothetical protein [Solicola gregarius]|uniref:DUF559 domain-containing protein n=1 Tax=Solicola gregarius TaxID=2908642 RepID=A0AA46TGJ1_9ACTN|nr:hypothetical protein [Solicola gregarius]UYM04397.1 hypothetical protein L0C25_17930 [Solicola gregarius]
MRDIGYVPDLTKRAAALQRAGVTKWALRGPEYESPYRGLHRPAGIAAEQPATRVADAIGLMTGGCVLTGWASRWVQGQAYCGGVRYGDDLPVVILCGPGTDLRTRPGIRPSDRRYLPGEVVDLESFAVTTMARATYDDMLDAPNPTEALVAVEMATSTVIDQACTSLDNVRAVFDAHVKTRGRAQARWALAHASTRSASPWETRTRMIATHAVGVENWLINTPIFDLHERLLGIPDLLDPDTGLVIESDGADHRKIEMHNADNVRGEGLRDHALEVVRIGSAQHSREERARTEERIRNGRDRPNPNRPRLWTTEKPAWWTDWPPGRRWD